MAEGEKFRGLDKSAWWLGDEAETSIGEANEMVWDDEYCNDEDAEYDEEGEEEEEEEDGNGPDNIPGQETADEVVGYDEEEEGEGDAMGKRRMTPILAILHALGSANVRLSTQGMSASLFTTTTMLC